MRIRCLLSVILLLLCLPSPPAAGQPALRDTEALGAFIDGTLDTPAFGNAFWGALVVDAASGEVLYARNAEKSFVPASNVKLYTAAAALEQLGPDYRYVTRLYADGPIRDGVLQGNLIVRGAGDPTLGGYEQRDAPTAVFEAWADSLRARGVRRIQGDLIGDDDVFDDTPLGYGWAWDDEPFYYAAEIGGLTFNQNVVDFTLVGRQPGRRASVRWAPYNTTYVDVINRTRSVPSGERIDEEYARARGTNVMLLETEVPTGRTEREALSITNPTLFFTHVLREALQHAGITVGGQIVDIDDVLVEMDYAAPDMQPVAHFVSLPLRSIAASTLEHSLNLYAEQLLRTLGAERPRYLARRTDPPPGSAAMGVRAAGRTLGRAGVDTTRIRLADGSGLSRQNLVTPTMTVALLRYMNTHPDPAVQKAFYDALPVGGREGTLEYRFRRDAPARGNVRAKTGTLSGTSALSGYVTTAGGRRLAFSLMSNHVTQEDAAPRRAQDRIVNALARYQE